MGLVMNILIAIVVVMVLYWIFNWFTGGISTKLSGMYICQSVTLAPNALPSNNNTNNYTYSTWIYVNDWNYRFGEQKVVLELSWTPQRAAVLAWPSELCKTT